MWKSGHCLLIEYSHVLYSWEFTEVELQVVMARYNEMSPPQIASVLNPLKKLQIEYVVNESTRED